jgi:hypothetical protein
MLGSRPNGDVCAAGFDFSDFGFLFARVLFW